MGPSKEWPVERPFDDQYHQVKSKEMRVRRAKLATASIAVVIIVIVAALTVMWFSDRVDCRLYVTVVLIPGPNYTTPELLEGSEVKMVLYKGEWPLHDYEIDSVTTHTDDNRTAHGILVVKSVGEWGVWPFVFGKAGVGQGVDVSDKDDGETISVNIPVIVDRDH